MKNISILSAIALLAFGAASADVKYKQTDKGDFIEITQQGGLTLGYDRQEGC